MTKPLKIYVSLLVTAAPQTFHCKFLCLVVTPMGNGPAGWLPAHLLPDCSNLTELLLVCECIGVYVFWFFFLKLEALLSEQCLLGHFLSISDAFVLPVEDFKSFGSFILTVQIEFSS